MKGPGVTEFCGNSVLEWFALSVKPRFDKAVTAALATKGFETFLALRKKRNIYRTRCREVDLPVFPGYVFCRFNISARLPILSTPGVLQILGLGPRPSPVPDVEITSLKTATNAQIALEPYPFPPVGHQVCIEEGALAGIQGTVVSVKHSRRIVLSVTLLQRSVLLETDYNQVTVTANQRSEWQWEAISPSS